MRAMVIGIKHIDFTPKGESKPIAGDKLQVVREFSMNEEGQGQMVDQIWIKAGSPLRQKVAVGQEYEFCHSTGLERDRRKGRSAYHPHNC